MISAREEFAELQSTVEGLACVVAQHHDIPIDDVLMTIAPKGRHAAFGWFSPERWCHISQGRRVHEIVIAAEHLDRDAEAVATTVIHELVHLAAELKGISETSRQGRWHNRRFGELALEFGLRLGHDPTHGVVTLGLRPETFHMYADQITALKRALILVRSMSVPSRVPGGESGGRDGGAGRRPAVKSRRRQVRASCGCVTDGRPRTITVPSSSWEPDSIYCRICSRPFAEEDES